MRPPLLQLLRRRLILPLLVLLPIMVAGCASLSTPSRAPEARFLDAGPQAAVCARFFQTLDRAVDQAGVADVQEARISGFPYVRVNRFLAADWRPLPDDARFENWARHLMALDRRARENEVANLPPSLRASILPQTDEGDVIAKRVNDCGEFFLALDLSSPESRKRLSEGAAVPDGYRAIYRVAGLYPITSIPFYLGVKGLQDEIQRDFSVPMESIATQGRLIRYLSASPDMVSPDDVAQILRRASNNPLGFPDPDATDRIRLFKAFAPVLEIDVAQEADRIGRPNYRSAEVAQVDTEMPVVYTRLSHTRFESKTLLQLNYIFWFPSRPKKGAIDILAGHLDGISWRVTLDEDGTPLVFDSMHNCGCYHLFLPTQKLRRRETNEGFEEPLLSPQHLTWRNGRTVVRIASRSHYLQRVYFQPAESAGGIEYRLEDYAMLRSLPAAEGGRRSLFGEDSLVRGSERPERWLFWPMGVPSAGAMRQWGHHATAFVGRRHFDDPELIARYFERVPSE